MHAESDTWVYWQECAFTMQFWGQYIDVKPTGLSHLIFKDTGDHFTWTKVSTKVFFREVKVMIFGGSQITLRAGS